MDETTKAIIERITRRHVQPITVGQGEQCTVFYNCIELTPNELTRLAADATGDLSESTYDVAVGIAYTGIFFAAAIAGGSQVAILRDDKRISGPDLTGKRVVIVDDVAHSGRSLLAAEKLVTDAGAVVVGYVCIIDRSNGSFGSEQKPLWSAYQTIME